MPHMYILRGHDGTYYTGSTIDLEKGYGNIAMDWGQIIQKKRLPVKLIYCEEFARIEEAFFREKQVQGWSRKKKEALIKQSRKVLKRFAECQNQTHFRGFDSAQPPCENKSL